VNRYHPIVAFPFSFLCLVMLLAGALVGCGSSEKDQYADRMATEHAHDDARPSGAATAAPAAPVEEQEVTYATLDGTGVRGFLARPADDAAGAPGILVIQEWWGLNDNIRAMASRLAGEGYVALAVDLYEGEVAEDPDRARELMSRAMGQEARLEDNLRQAYAYLVEEQGAERVGVIGWCFGGGWSLQTALMLPDEIDATVIYYGRLVTDRERLATLRMPILGFFGDLDQGIPVDQVHEFEAVLEDLGKDASITVYEGANHAFANPSGTRYVPEAAEDAWAKTLAFFDRNLRQAPSGESF